MASAAGGGGRGNVQAPGRILAEGESIYLPGFGGICDSAEDHLVIGILGTFPGKAQTEDSLVSI